MVREWNDDLAALASPAREPIGVHAGQDGDLLPPQTRDPAAVGGHTDLLGAQARPVHAQKSPTSLPANSGVGGQPGCAAPGTRRHGRAVATTQTSRRKTPKTEERSEQTPRSWRRHRTPEDGRYDEARGERRSAYTGRYPVTGKHLDYVDDTGFAATADIRDGVLYHEHLVLYEEEQA
jgi:hypothetical protein